MKKIKDSFEYEQLHLEIPEITPSQPVEKEDTKNYDGFVIVDLSDNVGIEIIDFNIL